MPAQDRCWGDQEQALVPGTAYSAGEAPQPVGECGEDYPIPPREAHWLGLLPLEQEQLLAEDGDFEVFGVVIPASSGDQVEHEREE